MSASSLSRSTIYKRAWMGVIVVGLLLVAAVPAPLPAAPADPAASWVIYTNEFGWLRVGTEQEFDEPWQQSREIWGGQSDEPLVKKLLRGGFETREEALRTLCAELTRVRLEHHGHATPRWTTNALYREKEYNLRLDRGLDPDVAIWRGTEYDLGAEIAVLRDFGGITPRVTFGPQYLCHVYKRDTREGPREIDEWMCQPYEPRDGGFWIPDEMGFTQHHYYCDEVEGPFRESFSLATAMKRHRADRTALWPRSLKMTIVAGDVPDKPRDHGSGIDPVQPLVDPPDMREWVIYATEFDWLRIGTRKEFETPRPHHQEIWAGTGDAPVDERIVAESYKSYEQALRELCQHLRDVRWQHIRNNEPHDIIRGVYREREYRLQLVRDPELMVVITRGYDFLKEWETLARFGITPKMEFGKLWLVESKEVGTMYGPRETNYWMFVTKQPEGNTVHVPDGQGGWFGHTIGDRAGPVTDNFGLGRIMKAKKIASIQLPGGPGILAASIPDNPRDHGRTRPPPEPRINKVEPPEGTQGKEVFVTVFAQDVERGAEVSFGPGIKVVKPFTRGSRDPARDSKDFQWLVTVSIEDDATPGKRDVKVENAGGAEGIGAKLFEVVPVETDLRPFVKLIAPASTRCPAEAAECRRLKAEQERHIEDIERIARERTGEIHGPKRDAVLRRLWKKMQEARYEMEEAENLYWESFGQVLGDQSYADVNIIVGSLRARGYFIKSELRERLDKWRECPVQLGEEGPYTDRRREYLDALAAQKHTLKLWRSLAVLLQHRYELELQAARRAKALGENADLELSVAQENLCDARLMMGEVSLLLAQPMTELGLQLQDCCGAALRETRKTRDEIEFSEMELGWGGLKRIAQEAIFTTKYALDISGIFVGGTVETLKGWFNAWVCDFFSTTTADIQKRIDKSRDISARKFAAVGGLRTALREGRTDEVEILRRVIVGAGRGDLSADLELLDSDRVWVEDTEGGLLRIASSFDESYARQMETEYRIATHRAELALRDLHTTLSLKLDAQPATGKMSYWRLLDPMALVRDAFGELFQDEFSSRMTHLDNRTRELSEMRELMPFWRENRYDPTALRYDDVNRALHDRLLDENPYYIRLWIAFRILWAKQAADQLVVALQDPFDPEFEENTQKLRRLQIVPLYVMKDEWADIMWLEGADRLMLWDWQGALANFEAVEQTYEPHDRPQTADEKAKHDHAKAAVKRLRKALDWHRSTEVGAAAFQHTGNLGLRAAFFQQLGELGGALWTGKNVTIGMSAPGEASVVAARVAGKAGRFGSPAYWGSFARYTMNQVCPLSRLLRWEPEWKVIKPVFHSLLMEGVEEAAGRELSRKIIVPYFGVDEKYADNLGDMLAEVTSNVGETAIDIKRSVALQEALRLRQNRDAFERLQVNVDLMRERGERRRGVIYGYEVLSALAEISRRPGYRRARGRGAAGPDAAARPDPSAARQEAEVRLRGLMAPITPEMAATVANRVVRKLAEAGSHDARLELCVKAMQDVPFRGLRNRFRDNVRNPVAQRYDAFRRELCATVLAQFLEANPRYASYVQGIVYTGSAAHPDGPAYKFLSSDADIALLLGPDTPESMRRMIKREMDAFFLLKAGMCPEALDLHLYADRPPSRPDARILALSYSNDVSALLRAFEEQPALVDAVRRESEAALEALWHNILDPERYAQVGGKLFIDYKNKLEGSVRRGSLQKTGDGFELAEDRALHQRLYGNVRFEARHGFDLMLDVLFQLSRARESKSEDMFSYARQDLSKDCIRALAALVMQNEDGLVLLNTAEARDAEKHGGTEGFILHVARWLGAEALGLTPHDMILLGEWLLLKQGRPLHEVFAERSGGVLTASDTHQLNVLLSKHINESEQLVQRVLMATVRASAEYLSSLMLRAEATDNPEHKAALQARFRRVLASHLIGWQRLSAEEQALIRREAPANAPFWRMIEAFGRIEREAAEQRQRGTVDSAYLTDYWPVTLATEDRERELPARPNIPDDRLPFAEPVSAAR